MEKVYLQEAFKQLEYLTEEDFNLDAQGAEEMKDFIDTNTPDNFIDIVDPEADTEEEVQDSYEGDVILSCEVCHTWQCKNPDEVIIDEESQLANISDECPFCYSTDGYKIIGEVAPYHPADDVDIEIEDKECEDGECEEAEVEDGGEVEETINELEESINEDCGTEITIEEAEQILEVFKREKRLFDNAPDILDDGFKSNGDYYVELDNSNPTYISSLEDSLRDICKRLDIGYEDESNGNGFYGRTYIFYHYCDEGFHSKCGDDLNEAIKKSIKHRPARRINEGIFNESVDEALGNSGDDDYAKIERALNKPHKSRRPVKESLEGEALEELVTAVCNRQGAKPRVVRDRFYKAGFKGEDLVKEYIRFKQSGGNAAQWVKANWDKIAKVIYRKNEALENVDLETSSEKIHISSEPKNDSEGDMIVPITSEVKDEIDANSVEDDTMEDETIDYDIEDFDEDRFNELGESYLKKIYENVNSFKTSSVKSDKRKLVVEGIINFTSGKNKRTQFIFESRTATKNGRVKFIGENRQISRGKKSFTLTGAIDNRKFFSESLNYNYRAKTNDGSSTRVYGTVRR